MMKTYIYFQAFFFLCFAGCLIPYFKNESEFSQEKYPEYWESHKNFKEKDYEFNEMPQTYFQKKH